MTCPNEARARPSRHRWLLLLTASMALWGFAPVAHAQSIDEVAEAVEFRGYFVEDGLDVSIDVLEGLVDAHPDIGFVALGDSPGQGADLFAEGLLATVEDRDTVVVLTEDEVGLVSAEFGDEEIDAALSSAFAGTGETYEADFEQVAVSLSDGPAQPGDARPAGGGIPWWPVIIVVFVGGIWWMLRGNKKRTEDMVSRRVETARVEIRQQMTVIADAILEFSDRVDQDAFPGAVAHYRRAAATFGDAEERLERATTEAELEQLSDDLDEARWEMAAADAMVEGREVPPKPDDAKPEHCFFDPTHGAGVEEARLQTPAGDRTVMVCRADAERLRNGEQPQPRNMDVGGQQVPAPQAPRTHGGQGMDWLDAFSIIVGGMTGAQGYRWGRPRRGGFGGGFGGGMGRGGGFGMSLPSRRGSSRSVGRSRPASRSIGRGRRGR